MMGTMGTPAGWTCAYCGQWVVNGQYHNCPTLYQYQLAQVPPTQLILPTDKDMAELKEAVKALTEKVDKLVEIVDSFKIPRYMAWDLASATPKEPPEKESK